MKSNSIEKSTGYECGTPEQRLMNHLDLFSGIGGFALAAKWAGIETVAFCEIDAFCQKVLAKNFPNIAVHDDIKTFSHTDKVDLLTAGFPCQPFSVAGKKKGKSDDRYLWPEVIRVIREVKPTWCILENVPGIIPHLDTILEDLEKEGYTWQAFLIPAVAVGAPHKRERLWIITHTNKHKRDQRTKNQKASKEHSGLAGKAFSNTLRCSIIHPNDQSESQAYSGIGAIRSEWDARHTDTRKHWSDSAKFYWQENQSPIPGVDDGLPNGLHRNKALGNAIVPQIPYLFMMMILEIERATTDEGK